MPRPSFKDHCSRALGNRASQDETTFNNTLALKGQTIIRRRAADDDGSEGREDEYRVLVNNPFPRPFYPQYTEMMGGDNLANADRHYLQYRPDVDIKEGDYIRFVAAPEYEWIVDKEEPPYAPNDKLIRQQAQIVRSTKNANYGNSSQ